MKKIKNECVGCGEPFNNTCSSCGLKEVEVEVCDECGEEYEELFDIDGNILCENCALDYITDNFSVKELVEALGIGGVIL